MFGSKIKLDEDLFRRCKSHAEAAGYSSVEEFVHHVLEGALKKVKHSPPDEEEKILDRLKGLGYIE
ncbi:hypothetical protein [Candidatus Methylomirabilis sp.]|uniref:hypothetical protein n=1 Tax=Candidatus Methylomirabilis sp. TaxID=2032687 RepID=UPI00307642E9